MLTDLAEDGIKVRVLTNSFKANDVAVVHAFYGKYRQNLLEHGVQLYEFLPALNKNDLDKIPRHLAKSQVNLKGFKPFEFACQIDGVDEKQVLLVRLILDPRSAYLNTELVYCSTATTCQGGSHHNG